ncbi:MAG: hypothetical protein IT162_03345 [Bryobacterales bacterium]|nr:hypothetical protein [Bryobacterales bacterium]
MPDPNDSQRGQINYLKEAFKWQYNLIAMGGAAAFSLVAGSPLPMILAGGVELMYLATVPNMPAFQRLVRSWAYADEKKAHDERMLQMQYALPPEIRDRYRHLEDIADAIRRNYARLSSTSQAFSGSIETQLRGLLTAFVRMANADVQHIHYLQNTDVNAIRREVQYLKDRMPKESAKVQEINRKRIEILEKRLEKYQKIRENRQVIDAQCRAVEDVLQLIHDQSITMTDPQQVSERLENLVKDVEQTEETVREVESIFQMSDQLAPAPDSFGDSSQQSSRDRQRY